MYKHVVTALLVLLLSCPYHLTLARQQAKPGKIAGLVVNLATGEALPSAKVEVLGSDQTIATDTDGNFTLELPAGTYQLRATHANFIETVKEVVVKSGDITPVDIVLAQTGSGEVVEVRAHSDGEIGLLAERRTGTTISELIGRAEISNDSSSDAAGVLQRVPGLSVVNNKFVFVRGLGDRYSNTVMNDAVMPTPQPDRRVVPLDQVPSELIQTLRVLKTFTPDQPGEFAGGLVKIETLEFPNKSSLKFSTSLSGNSQTTFQDFLDYPGSRFDFLGFGLGRRSLPSVIPETQVRRGSQLIKGFTPAALQQFGRAFENVYEPRTRTAPLNQSYAVAGSRQFGKLGLVATVTYGNTRQQTDELRNFYRVASDSAGNRVLFAPTRYNFQVGSGSVRLGALANAAYKLNNSNKLLFKNFFSNDGSDEARNNEGFFDDRGTRIRNTRLRYTLTRTSTSQIGGEHLISRLGTSVLTWRLTYSRASFDEPDLRETLYEFDPTLDRFVYFDTTQSGLRMFSAMRENIREPGIDFSKFFFADNITFNFKIGFAYSNRDRSFNSRRFRFLPRGFEGIDRSASPERLYSAENIRPDGFELNEDTRPTDFYTATQDITAGYVMGDLTRGKWRFIGGVRFERSKQEARTLDLFAANAKPIIASLDDTDALPSIGAVYNFTNSINVRAGYSQTVSRPQFRELSPFEFTDVTGGRATLGNPNLKRARIRNFDVRTEWQRRASVMAFSFFYKRLIDPIEVVVEPTTALRTSFRNAQGATNRGFELELREDLGQLWTPLTNLSVTANYTFVSSKVRIGTQDLSVLTSTERPLAGQSRHLFNGSLDYEIPKWQVSTRALFNYTGARISDVGTFGLPDIIEKGYPALDLIFSKKLGDGRWEIKCSGENMLNRLVRFKIDDLPFQVFQRGRTFSAGISYTLF